MNSGTYRTIISTRHDRRTLYEGKSRHLSSHYFEMACSVLTVSGGTASVETRTCERQGSRETTVRKTNVEHGMQSTVIGWSE